MAATKLVYTTIGEQRMTVTCTISATQARRLVIMRQHLAGLPYQHANSNDIMAVMRDLRFLQIDPMRVVEQSHLLVLWSRLGNYDPQNLDTLLWKEKALFQDWAQTTSIVLTEDYPIFSAPETHLCHWRRTIRQANPHMDRKEPKTA